jgi:hypothetical protein
LFSREQSPAFSGGPIRKPQYAIDGDRQHLAQRFLADLGAWIT